VTPAAQCWSSSGMPQIVTRKIVLPVSIILIRRDPIRCYDATTVRFLIGWRLIHPSCQ